MRIVFRLLWLSGKKVQSFKSRPAEELFFEYAKRIRNFMPCEVRGAFRANEKSGAGHRLWFCDRSREARTFSSEQLASQLMQAANSGARELQIAVGGPDGFQVQDYARLKPDLLWSFGPLTLPSELAAVIAGEQIYRAFTIIHHLPYHCGH